MSSTDLGLHSDTLFEKGEDQFRPHQLIFSATPIPRTLSMTLYAGVNASVIDERPPGRTPITTRVMASERREAVIDRLAEACAEGAQAFGYAPRLTAKMANSLAQPDPSALKQTLSQSFGWPRARPMSSQEKQTVMREFKEGRSVSSCPRR